MTKIAWRKESENFCARKKNWLTEKTGKIREKGTLELREKAYYYNYWKYNLQPYSLPNSRRRQFLNI